MKIMIVDDHDDMRRVLRNYISFSKEGPFEIIECDSGEEALEQYSKLKPNCVLMDIELKSMSGFEVTEEILEKDPQAKIIIVTSYNTERFKRKAKKIGAVGFVAKDELYDLRTILNSPITNQ